MLYVRKKQKPAIEINLWCKQRHREISSAGRKERSWLVQKNAIVETRKHVGSKRTSIDVDRTRLGAGSPKKDIHMPSPRNTVYVGRTIAYSGPRMTRGSNVGRSILWYEHNVWFRIPKRKNKIKNELRDGWEHVIICDACCKKTVGLKMHWFCGGSPRPPTQQRWHFQWCYIVIILGCSMVRREARSLIMGASRTYAMLDVK